MTQVPSPVRRPRNWPHNTVLLGALLVALVVGAVAMVSTRGHSKPAAATSAPATRAPIPALSAGPTLPAEPVDPAGAVKDWYLAPGGPRDGFDRFNTDLQKIHFGQDGDVATINAQCETALADVRRLQDLPPAPVASVDTPWQSALTHFDNATFQCANAIVPTDLIGAPQELQAGAADLNTMLGAIRALS